MDGAVLIGCGLPIVHHAGPVRSSHGTRGQIDEAGVGRVRTRIGGGLGLHADGEVPRRQHGIRRRGAVDRRSLKLAVVVTSGRAVVLRGNAARKPPAHRQAEARFSRAPRRYRRGCVRRLRHLEGAVAIERGRHVAPSPLQQATGNFWRAHAHRPGRQPPPSHRRQDRCRERTSSDRCAARPDPGGLCPAWSARSLPTDAHRPADRPAATQRGRSCRARRAVPCPSACRPSRSR